jgi:starvation-inducible outer membrane lipoprotein
MHSSATPLNSRSAALALFVGLLFTACTTTPSETSKDESPASEESTCKPKEEQACSCGKRA